MIFRLSFGFAYPDTKAKRTRHVTATEMNAADAIIDPES